MTWLCRILPFVERGDVWEQAKADYDADPVPFTTHIGMRTRLAVFECSSDPGSGDIHWTHESRIVATTNYLGVNGTDFRAKDGVFYLESDTRFSQVTDGQSNTLLIGERPPSTDYWYGWLYAGYGFNGSGSPDL